MLKQVLQQNASKSEAKSKQSQSQSQNPRIQDLHHVVQLLEATAPDEMMPLRAEFGGASCR